MYLKHALVAYFTVLRTEVKKIFRLWAQTILPPAITTTLYFTIFGTLMGRRIGMMHGLPYIDFIVPGLIMMTMLTSSFSASVSLFYMYKWTRVLEEILVSPMSATTILNSFMSVGIVRALIVGVIVSIVALLFTHVSIIHGLFTVLIAILACGIFSLLGVINAVYAKTFDQISIIPTFLITPLTYLGGVFYSLTILPSVWQHVAMFNPIVYIISAFRYAFYGYADTNIVISVMIMLVIFITLYLTCWYMIKTRKGISA